MPILFVIAGPNGIGKTTSSFDIVPENIAVINSDEIAKEVRQAGIIAVNAQEYSNREAIRLVEEQRAARNHFAIETNLSDLDTWKFLLEIQKSGYFLHVKYVSTDDLDLLNKRIALRVKQGEHYVSPDIVRERYVNGLSLLDHYFDYPEVLELVDNSKQMISSVIVSSGRILEAVKEIPSWISNNFSRHFDDRAEPEKSIREMTVEEIRKACQDKKK